MAYPLSNPSQNPQDSPLRAGHVIPRAHWRGPFPEPPAARGGEEPGNFAQHWRMLLRHPWILVLATLAGVLAGVLISMIQTPVYRAQLALEVEDVNSDFMNMRDLSPTAPAPASEPDSAVRTETKVLQSRALLDRTLSQNGAMARKLSAELRTGKAPWWAQIPGLGRGRMSAEEALVADLQKRLEVRPQPSSRIIDISFDDKDPRLAAGFANALAAEFIEMTLDQRWQSTQHTGDWLSKQMQDMRAKLQNSEHELQDYARAENLTFTDEKTNLSEERLRQLQEELLRAQADRVAKEARYRLAATAPLESLPEVLDDPTLKEFQIELAALHRQQAEMSSVFTPANPKLVKIEAQIAALQTALEKKRANIVNGVRNQYEAARHREGLLTADFGSQARHISSQADKVAHYNILKHEVDTTRQLYDSMFQRLKEAGLASALRASNIHVVDPAQPPGLPYKPRVLLNAVLGLLCGLFAGVGLVVVREQSDRRLHAPGDATLHVDLPELGIIPSEKVNLKRTRGLAETPSRSVLTTRRLELTAWQRTSSVMGEAYRAAAASILFSRPGGQPMVLVVSSATVGEGKTTVCSNLGIALAQANQRVLLIDGDLRRPRLHEIFETGNASGLSTTLYGKVNTALLESGIPRLFLLPAGRGNDANILFLPLLGELLQRLRGEFDIILIDSPPVLQVPDARIIARHADGVVLVARVRKTTRDAARLACERLEMDGTRVLGVILNDWTPGRASGPNYCPYAYQAYGYSDAMSGAAGDQNAA